MQLLYLKILMVLKEVLGNSGTFNETRSSTNECEEFEERATFEYTENNKLFLYFTELLEVN